MKTLRTAVVGVGHLGRFHAQKYAACSNLQGVFDQDAERAAAVAAELGCTAFASLEELLAGVDAISIATPTSTHFAVATEALRAGVHCLVEKPFTLDLAEAEALEALAAQVGKVLAVGHIERAHPAIRHLRGRGFSAPRYVEAERLAPFKPRSLDIDVIMDLMIHDLDLTLWFSGEHLQDIRAVGVAAVTDKADMANAWVTLGNGAVANLAASRVVREPVRRMRIFWEDRYASVDFTARQLRLVERGRGSIPGIPGVEEQVLELPAEDALEYEIRNFLGAVLGQEAPMCSAREGRLALAAALGVRAAVESFLHAKEGTPCREP
ncbi:MAG: Gfo/Idh/MocA family oxidoreductase [Acidithiobacillus caldus]|nr:Gfo/Idh/MocA family oxidoreductase [Acidithiobacillus caldus]